jgi:hypothetical protein
MPVNNYIWTLFLIICYFSGWHSRVNKDVGKSHLSFYVLVPALNREADLVDLSLQLVTEEQVLRDQRSRYRELQGRLHQYWSEFEEGHRTAFKLLRECGKVYGPAWYSFNLIWLRLPKLIIGNQNTRQRKYGLNWLYNTWSLVYEKECISAPPQGILFHILWPGIE